MPLAVVHSSMLTRWSVGSVLKVPSDRSGRATEYVRQTDGSSCGFNTHRHNVFVPSNTHLKATQSVSIILCSAVPVRPRLASRRRGPLCRCRPAGMRKPLGNSSFRRTRLHSKL